jgi:hypothetical protein
MVVKNTKEQKMDKGLEVASIAVIATFLRTS